MPKLPEIKPQPSLEQRVSQNIISHVNEMFSKLASEIGKTNELLAQFISERRSDTASWRKDSQLHRAEIVAAVNNLVQTNSQLTVALKGKSKLINPEYVVSKKLTVTTAGTAVQFPPLDIPYEHEVTIKALAGNTGTVYVGHSKPDAEDHTIAFPLEISEAIEAKIDNLGALWLDADNASDGVSWIVEVEK